MAVYPTLYFIRHGQTDWNLEHRFQGQTDIPLNDKGRAQATRNGLALADLLEDPQALHYVSSPLWRTRETMHIIRRHLGLPEGGFVTDDRLKELSFGRFEGMTRKEMALADQARHDAFFRDPETNAPPGGETHAQLRARTQSFVNDLPGPSVIVAHGGNYRILLRLACGVDVEESFVRPVPQDKVVLVRDGGVTFI